MKKLIYTAIIVTLCSACGVTTTYTTRPAYPVRMAPPPPYYYGPDYPYNTVVIENPVYVPYHHPEGYFGPRYRGPHRHIVRHHH